MSVPFDLLAEEMVCGAVLEHPGAFYDVQLSASDFYDLRAQAVWRATEQALKRFDELPVSSDFVAMVRDIMVSGGAEQAVLNTGLSLDVYLSSLLERIISDVDLAQNAGRVVTHSKARSAIALSEAMGVAARANGGKPEAFAAVLDAFGQRLADIASGQKLKSSSMTELLSEAMNRASRIRAGLEGLSTFRTGLSVFDELLARPADAASAGLSLGHYTVIAAKRKMGKSRLALRLALEMAISGVWAVDFYSLEMVAADTADMLASAILDCGRGKLLVCDDETFDRRWRLVDRTGELADSRFFFGGYQNLADIKRATTARAQRSQRPVAVFVDYLQLLDAGLDDEYANVTKASKELAKLARRNNCAVIATAQFNRQAAAGVPQVHHLRSSGQIEQDVNELFILHRPYEETPNATEEERSQGLLRLALNRHGPSGQRNIRCELGTCNFAEHSWPSDGQSTPER